MSPLGYQKGFSSAHWALMRRQLDEQLFRTWDEGNMSGTLEHGKLGSSLWNELGRMDLHSVIFREISEGGGLFAHP